MGRRSGHIAIAVVYGKPSVRKDVAESLSEYGRFDLVAGARSFDAAWKVASRRRPDVMLIDMTLVGAMAIAGAIKSKQPAVKVLMLAGSAGTGDLAAALEVGASGIVLTKELGLGMAAILADVVAGKVYVTPELENKISADIGSGRSPVTPARESLNGLTKRECDILGSVAEGLSTKQIASRLDLTERAVQHGMSSVLDKLGMRSRVEAASAFKRLGLNERRH
ncbi:MAG: response regulator transcription factor [Hyphomicrobiaceae bacterium]